MPLRQAHEIGAMVGLALFNHEIAALGVQPTDNRGAEGPRYNETAVIAVLRALQVRVTAALDQAIEDDDI